jgi:hypothetical protein
LKRKGGGGIIWGIMRIEAIERHRPKTGRDAFDVLLLFAAVLILMIIAAS